MAGVSLREHLAVSVDPQLPGALVGRTALARIHAIAAQLPADLSDFFGFESRLADSAPEADFLVCTKAPGRPVLADGDRALPPAWLAAPAWAQLVRFAQRWNAANCAWQGQVQNAWMEFDLAGTAAGDAPVPSLFLGTDALPGGLPAAPGWLADEALPLCRGKPLGAALRAQLDATLAALPPHAHVFQVGMMLARPGADDALRVCLRRITRSDAMALVAARGWPGEPQRLGEAWDFAARHATDIDLDIDLLPALGPKLGLECSFGFGPDAGERLAAFLDALVARGLCQPAKRDGLLAWTRAFHERQDPPRWPADLRARAAAAPEQTVSMFTRWVYHVKLVVRPDGPWEAKAYLAVAQTWMTAALMQQIKTASHTA